LGIGTTAPAYKLDVNGNAGNAGIQAKTSSGWAGLQLSAGSSTYSPFIYQENATNDLRFNINGDKMILTSTGNVGIGTTAPTEILHVAGAGIFTGASNQTTGQSGVYIDYGSTAANTGRIMAITPGSGFRDMVVDGLNLRLRTSGTDRLYVRSDGNVGIGTTAPNQKLDIITGDTTNSQLHLGETANAGGYFTTNLPGQMIMSGGAELVSSAWTARDTTAGMVSIASGDINFRADTGLTSGNTFTHRLE
jgi:hypothetical protein